jgi:hypothetical protein
MTQPSIGELKSLMEKLDQVETLTTVERGLLWAIFYAAKDSVRFVEVPQEFRFEDEFANSFTAGKVDAAEHAATPPPQAAPVMIIR